MKAIVLSFDDGTIYDEKFIKLLNKYNLKATLNLNSGLDNFIWYYEDKFPIKRLNLSLKKELFINHEVASHTITHPYITGLSFEDIIKEVEEDRKNLSNIFNQNIESFAIPFDQYNEEIIEIIKNNTKIKNIRIPLFSDSYIPKSPYHVHINAFYDDIDIYKKLELFSKNNLMNSMFVIVGHSYEFEVKNDWEKIENLLKYISNLKDCETYKMKDAINLIFK